MAVVDHLISQPSSDISPIWIPIITAEVRKLQLQSMQITCANYVFKLVPYKEMFSLVIEPILILTLAVKSGMYEYIGTRPRVCTFLIIALTLADSLSCTQFIYQISFLMLLSGDNNL